MGARCVLGVFSNPCLDLNLQVALYTCKTEHWRREGGKMTAPSASGLSVEGLLRVTDVK